MKPLAERAKPKSTKTSRGKRAPQMVVTSETLGPAITESFLDGDLEAEAERGIRLMNKITRGDSVRDDIRSDEDARREPRLEWLPLTQLLGMAHKGNPKEHDVPALVDSFKRFGFVAFPTIDEATGVMVTGHGRCEALEAMQVQKMPPPMHVRLSANGAEWMVPVIRGVRFSSETERDAYLIADNQHVMNGGWRFDALQEMLRVVIDDTSSVGLGFQVVELDSLLGNFREDGSPPDGFDPEASHSADGDGSEGGKGRTQITARIECPKCGHMIER